MVTTVEIEQFLELNKMYPVFDVRSPSEYTKGHIPAAHSLPLFSDTERAIVGTLYKKQGKHAAMHKALEIVGPHLSKLVTRVAEHASSKTVLVHCWRGGMRSASVGWLLSLFGYTVYVLQGGYKRYRAYMRATFEKQYTLCVISGKTGSGKTALLTELMHKYQVINLEALARHKGSVFGAQGYAQPTQEQFENELGVALWAIDSSQTIFIEDESRVIGSVALPIRFFETMRASQRITIEAPFDERVTRIITDYASVSDEIFYSGLARIQKHLGGLESQKIQTLYASGDRLNACKLLMRYYDAAYEYSERKSQRTSALMTSYDGFKKNLEKGSLV